MATFNQNKGDWIWSYHQNLWADLYNSIVDALVQTDTELVNPVNLGKQILSLFFIGDDH